MRPSPPRSAAEQRRPPLDAALLDVEAVAELLSCSTRTVRRMADSGQMPRPVKLSSLVRWRAHTGDPQTGVQDWLTDGCPRCDKRASR